MCGITGTHDFLANRCNHHLCAMPISNKKGGLKQQRKGFERFQREEEKKNLSSKEKWLVLCCQPFFKLALDLSTPLDPITC